MDSVYINIFTKETMPNGLKGILCVCVWLTKSLYGFSMKIQVGHAKSITRLITIIKNQWLEVQVLNAVIYSMHYDECTEREGKKG